MPRLDVYESGTGFYIGTYCHCGPYIREPGYYPTRELAQASSTARLRLTTLTAKHGGNTVGSSAER